VKQTLIKPTILKINNRLVKKYEVVQKPVNSWAEITRQIDELFDQSLKHYTLLHKPHNEYYWISESYDRQQ
jgi:16S rRNA U516 pseudouridylate synthase RsuA-like enzyme